MESQRHFITVEQKDKNRGKDKKINQRGDSQDFQKEKAGNLEGKKKNFPEKKGSS